MIIQKKNLNTFEEKIHLKKKKQDGAGEHICIGPVHPVYLWLFQNSTNPGLQGIYGWCMQHWIEQDIMNQEDYMYWVWMSHVTCYQTRGNNPFYGHTLQDCKMYMTDVWRHTLEIKKTRARWISLYSKRQTSIEFKMIKMWCMPLSISGPFIITRYQETLMTLMRYKRIKMRRLMKIEDSWFTKEGQAIDMKTTIMYYIETTSLCIGWWHDI